VAEASTALLVDSVGIQRQLDRRMVAAVWVAIWATTLFLALVTYRTGQPPFTLALLVLVLSMIAIVVRPAIGVHVVVFFTLIGDNNTSIWFPMAKNFSSRESILFLSDQIIVSPLEVLLVWTTLVWFVQLLYDRRRLHRATLLWPVLVFGGFVVLGLMYGLARNGDTYAALWEVRPLLYVPLLYVLITNLFTRVEQYRLAFWLAVVAIGINAVIALQYRSTLSALQLENLESLIEHGAAVHIDLLFVALFATWMFPQCGLAKRWALVALTIPAVPAYFYSQRRAAFVALLIGFAVFAVVLRARNRRAFRWFVPIGVLVVGAYTAAFWSSTADIAPDQISAEDQNSNLYRIIENYDIWFTIRAEPVTGIGFGHPFYRPVALPDISFFPFFEYIPHNSMLWIWMKTGFLGFVSLLFLLACAIRAGVSSLDRVRDSEHAVLALVGLLYVVMYAVFAYVDIAWDTRGMVFFAFALACCSEISRLVGTDATATLRRSRESTSAVPAGLGR
jgi:O-antigen ligase